MMTWKITYEIHGQRDAVLRGATFRGATMYLKRGAFNIVAADCDAATAAATAVLDDALRCGQRDRRIPECARWRIVAVLPTLPELTTKITITHE